ncbi:Ecdysteroid kinase-like family [Popillia japonica]|uniref:Ecdysteroid kinase-like family n=1 Tax=Popillia japonica TaxID=7064 RepID=A0AAW1JGR1_POPJA
MSLSVIHIRNFEQLVEPFLSKLDKTFLSFECKNLLPPGENYGSVMLQVEIKVLNRKNEEEIVHCVGKTVPPNNYLWEVFNTKVTFKSEIGMYQKIVPALNQFGEENGVHNLMDFFAECFNARISLDAESNCVDEDALLLLQNLKVEGYDVMDRIQGLDLDCTKVLLKNMAVMHAAPIAYRLAKREEFHKRILPFLVRDTLFSPEEGFKRIVIKTASKACEQYPECIAKIQDALNIDNLPPLICGDTFSTLIHNDLWTNNVMIKMIDGTPQKSIIVDFQGIEYDKLNQECELATKEREFVHLLIMFNPILTLKDKAKNLAELDGNEAPFDENSLHKNYYERVQFVVTDLLKRGWI